MGFSAKGGEGDLASSSLLFEGLLGSDRLQFV